MFEKLYGSYFKRGRFHVHIYFLDGKKQYRTFATEEEARDFITHNERKVFANPITGAVAVVWLIGGYAVVFGITLLVFGLRLRGLRSKLVAQFGA